MEWWQKGVPEGQREGRGGREGGFLFCLGEVSFVENC